MLIRLVLQSAVLQVNATVMGYGKAHTNSPLLDNKTKKSRVAQQAAREAANGLPKAAGKGSKAINLTWHASKQAPNCNEGDEGNPDLEEEEDVADANV